MEQTKEARLVKLKRLSKIALRLSFFDVVARWEKEIKELEQSNANHS